MERALGAMVLAPDEEWVLVGLVKKWDAAALVDADKVGVALV